MKLSRVQVATTSLAASLLLLAVASVATAAKPEGKPAKPKPAPTAKPAGTGRTTMPATRRYSVAPQPEKQARNVHGPYAAGDCGLCHERDNPKDPGKLSRPANETCLECHDDFQDIMKRPYAHEAARRDCTVCHNPHNSKKTKLLHDDLSPLCTSCHGDMTEVVGKARVKHKALTEGAQCGNCHNPHASSVEHLLTQLPFDLCVSCHSRDGLVDEKGRKLTNFKRWLDENPVWHAPVAAKDCSACHKPHGGKHFRLLEAQYPAEFYATYDADNYAICFACHNPENFGASQTTTLTKFRDGSRNLHYLHVNKVDRGRTCRACHEVHAAKQDHHIRDGVPYGTKGWVLKINYVKTSKGGSCEKTCHTKKDYDNTAGTRAAR